MPTNGAFHVKGQRHFERGEREFVEPGYGHVGVCVLRRGVRQNGPLTVEGPHPDPRQPVVPRHPIGIEVSTSLTAGDDHS